MTGLILSGGKCDDDVNSRTNKDGGDGRVLTLDLLLFFLSLITYFPHDVMQ